MGKKMLAIVFTLSLLLGSALSGNLNALATDGGISTLELVLNQSKAGADQKIIDLQTAGLVVPDTANLTYSQGLAEYQTAMSLVGTDIQGSKVHALKAMDLFTNVIQLIDRQQNSTVSDSNLTATLVQSIADSQENAEQIKTLVKANSISDSVFNDYGTTINAARASIANGDFQLAAQQISTAQNLLDRIYQQLQNQAQASVDSRANQFLVNTKVTLSQMIENAKSVGLSQSTIDALQNELDKLNDVKTTRQIIDITNESSQLQDTTDQYDNQSLENFDKESSTTQQRINVLQTMAEQSGLQLAGFEQLIQTLDSIKQKIASGQAADAASELDQENSLLSGMSGVVNGAPSIVREIGIARNMSQTLQDKAQAQNDLGSLDKISQATQLLDDAYSTILNATSSDDLKSASDSLSQAESILNGVSDILNSSNQQQNQTQNSNQTNSTETNSTETNSSSYSISSTPNENSTETSNQSNSTSASNSNATG